MIQTTLHVSDSTSHAIDALRSLSGGSYRRSAGSFPTTHWKVDFEHLDLAETRRAAHVLRSCGYRAVTARQVSDTISVIFARCEAGALESIGIPAPFCPETDVLLGCPRGLFVAIFGPDGVGKSSIGSAVVSGLAPFFDHQRTVCWRPQFISSRIPKEPHKFKLPHDASLHAPLTSVAKLTGSFADFFLDHATLTRNQLRGSSLIVWDRYFHDFGVDPKRYRYQGPARFSRLLLRSLSVPDHFLGIVLDADENVILRRKQELPLDELQRQRSAYRRLADDLPHTHVVTNEGDFEACLQDVLSLAMTRMAGWFEPIAGDLLHFDAAI